MPPAHETIRTRLKYQRAPTVEWYLVTHHGSGRNVHAAATDNQ